MHILRLLKRGIPKLPSADPSDAQVNLAIEIFDRLTIIGVDNPNGYGYAPNGPWFLVDGDTAEPEVNWPGELISEHANRDDARRALFREVLKAGMQK